MDPLSIDSTLIGLALYASLRKNGQDSADDEVRALRDIGLNVVFEPEPETSVAVE